MNLLLHGIGADGARRRAGRGQRRARRPNTAEYDMVLTNPPFGKKSSVTIVNEDGRAEKEIADRSTATTSGRATSNKQLNFLQHVFTILKQHGRAAIVVPDNVLFEGGAGETVRRELLKQATSTPCCACPPASSTPRASRRTSSSSTASRRSEKPWTEKLWIYDLRTNKHFTLKENPLKRADLDDFVACYNAENRHERSRERTLQELHLRRPRQARQGQPRHLLAQRRNPRRLRQPARSRHHRRRDRRRPPSCARTVQRDRVGPRGKCRRRTKIKRQHSTAVAVRYCAEVSDGGMTQNEI